MGVGDTAARWDAMRSLLEKHGQAHVLTPPPPAEKSDAFLQQLEALDVPGLAGMYERSKANDESIAPPITPFTNVTSAADLPDSDATRAHGLQLIGEGKVAALLLAGGQGTRLGSSAPKGCYDIGMPSHKSLFQYHAERVRAVKRLAAAHVGKLEERVRLPFLVMTSGATDAPTRAFWSKHRYFGLPKEDVHFFEQGMLPCLTPEGKLMLKEAGDLAEAPNGNGGLYISLHKLGLLEMLTAQGVESIFQFGVDNVLCHAVDPIFVGFCDASDAECGVKTIPKTEPHEKVGVLALEGGRPKVVEYSEITNEMAESRESACGSLLYGASHICVNWFSMAFLRRFCRDEIESLPLHVAKKKIPTIDADGAHINPEAPNGIKLELFVFDTFPHARKLVALQVPREDEFAPVKNAPGSASDSPDTARSLFSALCRSRLHAAGGSIKVPRGVGESEALLEISPLVSYAGEGLASLVPIELVLPAHLDEIANKGGAAPRLRGGCLPRPKRLCTLK